MAKLYAAIIIISLLSLCTWGAMCATFTIRNNCGYTVWPGMLSGAGTAPLSTTGFALASGQSSSMDVPSGWSGRFWGRTLCSADATTGVFSCATGDCGSGTVACSGTGAAPPATLAEFTLDGSGGMDFYDVSLVDGYNLPMLVVPQGGTAGNCTATGCLVDLNGVCPSDLKVVLSAANGGGAAVACKSACEAFGSPQYCCSGAYGNPTTCKPSAYSEFFKNACPRAYSYAYDDATSTFTCAGANYLITFCPSTASQKSSGVNSQAAGLPLVNDTMVFLGGDSEDDTSSSAVSLAAAPRRALSFALALLTVSLLLLKQQLF
ncbi:thaumatin-like protein 1b [Ananas comosus]|uniref:Thaumatin-like protein 1 n=1 Tax=Ananas comosus TaxID=4615 RepID=A0A199W2F4_ANACO|nr:thaumatin-like protein 1b [Ananas comosus]OAY83426.1 Thaumatin-like protein 1 [Ananas comosus]